MRIIAGQYRGRRLNTPKDNAVRPTSDKVRQAVFNMLSSRGLVQDAVVMDLFCGTGAMGLESLSQGASFCYFFDISKESIRLTQENATNLDAQDNTLIRHQDALSLPFRQEHETAVTLAIIDPPYNKGLVDKAITVLLDKDWLSSDTYFLIELSRHEDINGALLNIEIEKTYGDTKIILASLKRQNE